ncbi:MAG: endolytic transglycosylase MltG, partial [Oscillospiraceae bacterium]|nr:endolytic transglycosylase MltG [Oscillospiraceae bacterium]
TIPEGHNIFQVVQDLTSNGVCDEDELWDCLANYDFEYEFLDKSTLGDKLRLEGYLFPDTYSFYVGDTPSRVIGKLLKNFDRKWTEEMTEQAKALGYTQREILIVASMIEKEAGADSERATIASVIYNRLRDGGQGTNYKLQIDATLYYAAQIEGVSMSKDIDSPYNTYLVTGLPAGPIANPGIASIKAALDPETTAYYYYALGKEGVHHFTKTLEEHTAFVNSDEYGG